MECAQMLGFDALRLRILIERQLLHTGSARARYLLENWDSALPRFIKVMPIDYAKALADLKREKMFDTLTATRILWPDIQ